jgi:hypothetical protein
VCAWVGNQQSHGVVTTRVRTNVVQSLHHQRRDLHQSIYPLPLRRSGLILLSGTMLGQMDHSLGTQNYSVILSQPIYANNYIYALGVYDDEVRQKKSAPLMAILIAGHIFLVFISPPGEVTIVMYFMKVMGRLYFTTNFDAMKECDALESNKTIAGCEFARNIPNTTS